MYRDFLLHADLVAEEDYDSDKDPTFIPPPIFETSFDFDEYSDGEIKVLIFNNCLPNILNKLN